MLFGTWKQFSTSSIWSSFSLILQHCFSKLSVSYLSVTILLNALANDIYILVYPKKAWRLITDPVSGIFVPLIVISLDSPN
jgi:hypothetical protein